jgi:hypothetical protein
MVSRFTSELKAGMASSWMTLMIASFWMYREAYVYKCDRYMADEKLHRSGIAR